jgi:hypothetical protein
MSAEILDCGHVNDRGPKPGEGGPAGYATIKHWDTGAEQRICYACASVRERMDMLAHGKACLYLSRDTVNNWRVTDWASGLVFPAFDVRISPNGGGFGAQRIDASFVGPDGFIWHAINRGDMQLARCKRTKERP